MSKRPMRILTRRIRVTASSIRDMGTSPFLTRSTVSSKKPRHSSATMNTSMPALMARAHRVLEQPGTWAWPFQSPTTSPSKPILPLSTSVRRCLLPWILASCTCPGVGGLAGASSQLLNEGMMLCTPAPIAPKYPWPKRLMSWASG